MNKIFLSVASMLVTHFLMKIYEKATTKGPSKEEVYRQMRKEYEDHQRAEHDAVLAHLAKYDAVQAHLAGFLDKNPPGARFTECAERISVASTPMNGTRLSPIAQANLNLMESCRNG